jgi:hypothetical protein
MHPEYFAAWVLDERWRSEIKKLGEIMESQSRHAIGSHGFDDYEIHKMKRIGSWAEATANAARPYDFAHYRDRFYTFTEQYAEREGKKFLDVFPEMADFYHTCKEAKKQL